MNSGCFCCKLLTLFEQPFCATGSPMTDFTLFTRYIARESKTILLLLLLLLLLYKILVSNLFSERSEQI